MTSQDVDNIITSFIDRTVEEIRVNAFRQMSTTTTMVEVSALYVSMRNHHSGGSHHHNKESKQNEMDEPRHSFI
jgi:hypothetical protein